MEECEEDEHLEPNYFDKYKELKRKLQFLLYENQTYQDELRQSQKKMLQVTRDKNFLLERLMKYEGVTSESESDDEKLNEDKSRQGFSPAPPSFKRPNVLAVTPGHTPASITMPSPRGIMQSPNYESPRPNHSPTLTSPTSATFPSPAHPSVNVAMASSPKHSPRSRKASSNDLVSKTMPRKIPFPSSESAPTAVPKQTTKIPLTPADPEPSISYCSHVENGAQCTTEITKKSKTKLCGAHRRMLNKKKKQQSVGEDSIVLSSPNPHTPSSTIASSPASIASQSPHPSQGTTNEALIQQGLLQHPNYRPQNTPAPPGFPRPPGHMFPPSPHMQIQMQQYQLQMKRMMLQNPKEFYAQQQHFQQLQQQQYQLQQRAQQLHEQASSNSGSSGHNSQQLTSPSPNTKNMPPPPVSKEQESSDKPAVQKSNSVQREDAQQTAKQHPSSMLQPGIIPKQEPKPVTQPPQQHSLQLQPPSLQMEQHPQQMQQQPSVQMHRPTLQLQQPSLQIQHQPPITMSSTMGHSSKQPTPARNTQPSTASQNQKHHSSVQQQKLDNRKQVPSAQQLDRQSSATVTSAQKSEANSLHQEMLRQRHGATASQSSPHRPQVPSPLLQQFPPGVHPLQAGQQTSVSHTQQVLQAQAMNSRLSTSAQPQLQPPQPLLVTSQPQKPQITISQPHQLPISQHQLHQQLTSQQLAHLHAQQQRQIQIQMAAAAQQQKIAHHQAARLAQNNPHLHMGGYSSGGPRFPVSIAQQSGVPTQATTTTSNTPPTPAQAKSESAPASGQQPSTESGGQTKHEGEMPLELLAGLDASLEGIEDVG